MMEQPQTTAVSLTDPVEIINPFQVYDQVKKSVCVCNCNQDDHVCSNFIVHVMLDWNNLQEWDALFGVIDAIQASSNDAVYDLTMFFVEFDSSSPIGYTRSLNLIDGRFADNSVLASASKAFIIFWSIMDLWITTHNITEQPKWYLIQWIRTIIGQIACKTQVPDELIIDLMRTLIPWTRGRTMQECYGLESPDRAERVRRFQVSTNRHFLCEMVRGIGKM